MIEKVYCFCFFI